MRAYVPMNVDTPSSIALIHGLWMTPSSWENWAARDRPHFPGAPGWEEVADYALDWALRTARRS